ncbi:hypothetical protein R3W88_014633 [Solanum pinnatisectum]|uniref:Uncharacterized protein n=1 Tax=Solanum pinnatisectum TaxID=50273 RepID=A0AAV9KUL1_9SOLN|nr:hypothetical protein R3W88_014633 [Solanum pinnatisectum]
MAEENQGDVTVDLYAAFDMETEVVIERSSELENSQPWACLWDCLKWMTDKFDFRVPYYELTFAFASVRVLTICSPLLCSE